jgi:hypothetical protein
VERTPVAERDEFGRFLSKDPEKRKTLGHPQAKKYMHTVCQCGDVIRQRVAISLGRMHRCARCTANVWYQRQLTDYRARIRRAGEGASSCASYATPPGYGWDRRPLSARWQKLLEGR